MARDWNKILTFPMERRVTIEVWECGLVYILLQLMVVGYVGLNLYYSDAVRILATQELTCAGALDEVPDASRGSILAQWAFSEEPVGAVNAWPEAGRWTEHAASADFGELPYCDPAAFAYAYDPSFVMDDPQCQLMSPHEVSAKENGAVHFTTAFIEYREVGWACAAAHNASQWAACALRNGTVDDALEGGRQCVCSSQRTVYPVGVDLMTMAFEHSFQGAVRFDGRNGSSTRPAGSVGAVDTTVIFRNESGGKRTVRSGTATRLTVGEWVALATPAGLTLDDENRDLSPDYRPGRAQVYPRFRSAGLTIDLDVRYSNTDPETGRPGYDEETVFAEVTHSATTSNWADPAMASDCA